MTGSFNVKEWLDVLGKLGEFLPLFLFVSGAALAGFKFVFSPLRKMVKEHTTKINFIYDQLNHNSGSSLRDFVCQIKDSVIRQEHWQKTRLCHESLPYFDMDSKFKITWINKSFMRLLNCSENDAIGYGFRNFIDPRDKENFTNRCQESVENVIDFRMGFRLISSDGIGKCVLCEALTVRGINNEILGFTGILTEKDDSFCATHS